MESYLTTRAIEAVTTGNADGIKDCFDAEPNLISIIKHIIATKKYEMLPAVYPYFKRERMLKGDNELHAIFLPLCCELACSEEAFAHSLISEIMKQTELHSKAICYQLGKEGTEWEKIKFEGKFDVPYLEGALEGRHFSLLERKKGPTLYLQGVAGRRLNEEAMDYFGYNDTALRNYFDSLWLIDDIQKLFEILHRKDANYLPFACRYLNGSYDGDEGDKSLCRYLLSIGAVMEEDKKIELRDNDRDLYYFYFSEEV